MGLINTQENYKNYLATGTDDFLIPMTYSEIYYWFEKHIKAAGLSMTFHQLRHLSASIMLLLNIPEKYAMEKGGWKTPHTLKKHYQHTFSEDRKKVDDKMDDYFKQILDED